MIRQWYSNDSTKCVSALSDFVNAVVCTISPSPFPFALIYFPFFSAQSKEMIFHVLLIFDYMFLSPDRQSKINSESQQSEEVVVISSKRASAKVSNICIAPVDTSGSVSQQSSVIGSTDEGGFNEPSPEIKAKLKPAYSFETTASATDTTSGPEKRDDFNENDYNAHQHSLHYVDFGYRLNPDGSESKQCFSEETDDYVTARNHSVIEERETTVVSNVVHKKTTVHYPVADSIVYASIKSEPTSLSPPPPIVAAPPPPLPPQTIETKYNCVNRNYRIEDDYTNDTDNVSDIDEKFEQIYSSTANDKDDDGDIVDLNGDVDIDDVDDDDYNDVGDQRAFDLDNVEFADASEKDELPDAMTSYEADRLLSSR